MGASPAASVADEHLRELHADQRGGCGDSDRVEAMWTTGLQGSGGEHGRMRGVFRLELWRTGDVDPPSGRANGGARVWQPRAWCCGQQAFGPSRQHTRHRGRWRCERRGQAGTVELTARSVRPTSPVEPSADTHRRSEVEERREGEPAVCSERPLGVDRSSSARWAVTRRTEPSSRSGFEEGDASHLRREAFGPSGKEAAVRTFAR